LVDPVGLNSLEVRPSWGATYQIARGVFGDNIRNIFLGTGPNTFIYDWLRFKPVEVNQTYFWSSRFQSGIGLLPSFIATTGVLSLCAWIFFLLAILYYGFKTINSSINDITRSLLFSCFLGSVYLWIFNIIYVPSNFLFTLTFLITGLFFAMLIKSGNLKLKEFVFVNKTGLGFISALAVVLMLMVGVAAFYTIFQKYGAAYFYGQGIKIFSVEGDLDKAEEYFTKAIRFDAQDRYYRTLSEVYLMKLSNFLRNQQQLSQEQASSQFQNIFATAVQYAQTAVNANATDPLNWMSVGQVYESIVSLKVKGAKEAALDAYATALVKSPKDPEPLFASARVEAQAENNNEAMTFINSALALKSNYTSALFLSAQIAAREGDLKGAIQRTEMARLTSPNDVGVLFQLGLLYYQNEDYESSISVLERTVTLNPSYSNARYFLGLSYEKEKMIESAIAQFEVIQSLNPDNAEVQKILSNLKSGKKALSQISPPEPAPENRKEPPIKEGE